MTNNDQERIDSEFIFPNTEMGKVCMSVDWSNTPLGPTSQWPTSLRTMASMCLNNKFPCHLCWGPDLIQFYNEGFQTMLGARHPAMGVPATKTWWDIWDTLGGSYEIVQKTQQSVKYNDQQILIINPLEGRRIERYFTYGFSPAFTEINEVGGVVNTCVETTFKVINERQFKSLQDIALYTTASTNVKVACEKVAQCLSNNSLDIPFAAIYLADGTSLHLTDLIHINEGTDITPYIIASPTSEYTKTVIEVFATEKPIYFDLTGYQVPKSPAFSDPYFPRACQIFPVYASQGNPTGIIILGISPVRFWDECYMSYFRLLANSINSILRNANSFEMEQKKNDQLVALNNSKLTFFTNISHEFRTPLTLMLGPLDDLIAKEQNPSPMLLMVRRNCSKLLKLVNSLLEYSRLEAGRFDAYFEPIHIVEMTSNLCSLFGTEISVVCSPVRDPLYLDYVSYEKIVLNLVSNARKYGGKITVRVGEAGFGKVQLTVEDTGKGIPESEIAQIFDNFHVGKGMGLAIVQKLVHLHGGELELNSSSAGTTVTCTFRYGNAHLPNDRIRARPKNTIPSPQIDSSPSSDEWTPNMETPKDNSKSRILIFEKNRDMVQYLRTILEDLYNLELAVDTMQVVEKLSERMPDLVLADMECLELHQHLRNNPSTQLIPIIIMTTQPIEHQASSTDDYLLKPFTANELKARIASHISLFKLRQESTIEAEAAYRAKDHFLAVLSHELRTPLSPALLLAEQLAAESEDSVKQDLYMIIRGIKRNVLLIDDLLDVTRITKNKLVMHFKPCDIHLEIQRAIELVDYAEKNVQVEINLKAEFHIVLGDAARFQQVLWNIIKNAINYTPEKGSVFISTKNEDFQFILITISDTGKGMDSSTLEKIFDSFQAKQAEGLGLGLSISNALTMAMHGTLDASSEGPGLGSTFTLRFPVSLDAMLNKKKIPPQRILLVEDDKSSALVMARFLKKLGHTVVTANSVHEALEKAAKNELSLVISDIGLPDGSGNELMRELKERYKLRGICLSGFSEEVRNKESAFGVHLVKPVEMDTLESALQEIVNM